MVKGQIDWIGVKWLPGLPSQSVVLWDRLALRIVRIARGQRKITIPA
ncbi:hypothetical protein ACFL2Z_01735 [Candidatus Eisenbacteria bacterium]|uniref:Uncharacterized protein n=1 Tax=Eiseniibacteriota bacterium TaxID=2212470 RepID=A0ABV6YNI3_UNCEI